MTSPVLSLPSFRRQQLLLEYSALRRKCPEGIYASPHPSDPSIWSGVLFVRSGPYASAILRFEAVFPTRYPDVPPLVTFATEIFHPLLVPLTTYTFAAGALDPSLTVSSADTARLPPGSFHFSHGFPSWNTAKQKRYSAGSSSISSAASTSHAADNAHPNTSPKADETEQDQDRPSVAQVLEYMKRAFEDVELLDSLSLKDAGNPSAWHAWRAYRGLPKIGPRSISPAGGVPGQPGLSPARHPADWNWDGVWESRVRNGIDESISDAALYGSKTGRPAASANESIKFQRQDEDRMLVAQQLMASMTGPAPT